MQPHPGSHAGETIEAVYRSSDGTVSKYLHEDGSETAIKWVPSIGSVYNPLLNKIEVRTSERNKYSVFISTSSGCPMRCPFCHLTIKNAKYSPLEKAGLLANLKDALTDKLLVYPTLREKFIKLSWMGMGDALFQPDWVRDISLEFLDWVMSEGLARGLDGVDVATVLPRVGDGWVSVFQSMNRHLLKYQANPVYAMDNYAYASSGYTARTPFRLFFSLHSAIQEKRDVVVPKAANLQKAAADLKSFKAGGNTLIVHHLLVNGLNDSETELAALVTWMLENFPTSELRVLRYNFCAKSPYKESESFLRQAKFLSEHLPKLKIQVSPGSEVSAACGQFIVQDFIRGRT